MVRDPVCGMDIDEVDVPESLQSEGEGRVYHFCSPECKIEFDKDPRRFIRTSDERIDDLGAA
jgi:YHS domain-containing protein